LDFRPFFDRVIIPCSDSGAADDDATVGSIVVVVVDDDDNDDDDDAPDDDNTAVLGGNNSCFCGPYIGCGCFNNKGVDDNNCEDV
jgi:hypothetical protein